ncbi:actin-binding LIM protein 1 isoform X4 [Gadus morhua]|uniref:actin-binding LIM protein 1 isoform X4 n=1 Tax=Gadus morhua TaxID=8049 RepID=UPI0011B399E5|nr:actin-binding LIM protein 1-like isoform X4 [Gadus morhua]
MVTPLDSLCSSACWAQQLRGSATMSTLPSLNTLGRICGSSHSDDTLVLDRVKRKNSVRRMSIIEDGEIAEVLYLIPKQSMMEQLPFLNPNDYILCEKMAGMPFELPQAYQNHAAPPPPAPERRRVQCFRCGEMCKGEVLRVQARHFHLNCFTCTVCGCDLSRGGSFLRSGDYLCTLDYQRLHGTRCQGCGEYVEGEVVTALGKAYHPACFVCTSCRRPFPTGDRVTFNRKECLCQHCCIQPHPSVSNDISFSNNCVGCGMDIKNGQALLALEGQWHLGCFKCSTCHRLLTGEYISRNGLPYCERDYQVQFGVQCDACNQFIMGKVLEAGDRHFHPSCAQCCRCDLLFREGEEMFLQASVMWHPDCRSSSSGDTRSRATRSSTESLSSRPGSAVATSPGHCIYAKVDDQVVDYRDLAALPRVKAIFDIDSPDLLSYGTFNETKGHQSSKQDRPLPAQYQPAGVPSPPLNEVSPERGRRSMGPGSIHRHSYTPSVSPQHFHRPEHQDNLYMKPPIYKQHDTPPAAYQTSSLPGHGRHSGFFCQYGYPYNQYGYATDGTTGSELSRPPFSQLDRGLSLPNLLEHTVYPYEVLAVTSRGRAKLPKNVDRTRLERYLSPDSFYKVFEMNFQEFNRLPLWRRNDLKKIVNLF